MNKEGKWDGRSAWHAWDLRVYKILVERDELDDLGVDGMIKLKRVLSKWDGVYVVTLSGLS